MTLLFAPLQLFFETTTEKNFVNGVPWPRELARSLECCADVTPGAVSLQPALIDAIALGVSPEAVWRAASPREWISPGLVWDLSLVLPVSAPGVLRPASESAHQYWLTSAKAWLADWCERQGLPARVRVGWPVTARSALIQLFKQDLLDILKIVPAPVELYWEPGAILLGSAAGMCSLATRGLPRDTALYTARQCLERVSGAPAALSSAAT